MRYTFPRRFAAGALACLLAAGCGVPGETPAEPKSSSAPENTNEHVEPDSYPSSGAYPTWSPTARKAAVERAEDAMTAFTRTAPRTSQWWDALSGHLSDQAKADYRTVDPANIPADRVTGAGRITDDGSTYLARVAVPTDVGPYEVLLSRRDDDDPWLVERMTPPKGA